MHDLLINNGFICTVEKSLYRKQYKNYEIKVYTLTIISFVILRSDTLIINHLISTPKDVIKDIKRVLWNMI